MKQASRQRAGEREPYCACCHEELQGAPIDKSGDPDHDEAPGSSTSARPRTWASASRRGPCPRDFSPSEEGMELEQPMPTLVSVLDQGPNATGSARSPCAPHARTCRDAALRGPRAPRRGHSRRRGRRRVRQPGAQPLGQARRGASGDGDSGAAPAVPQLDRPGQSRLRRALGYPHARLPGHLADRAGRPLVRRRGSHQRRGPLARGGDGRHPRRTAPSGSTSSPHACCCSSTGPRTRCWRLPPRA